jgi:ELWxxDGT repeat protein
MMRALSSLVVAVLAAASLSTPVAAQSDARLVEDIHPSGGSDPRALTRVGEVVFFTANDGSHGRELWKTDGTRAGTRLVRDIRSGGSGSNPGHLTKVGGRLFFTANDGSHGRELWTSDGTRSGTRLVEDLTPGSGGMSPQSIVIADLGGTALFSVDYHDLWRSDGTAAGTRLVRRQRDVNLEDRARLHGRLLFVAGDGLWSTDGTASGTRRLRRSEDSPYELTAFKGHVYFTEWRFPRSPSLWWTDGTAAGTARLPGPRGPNELTVLGGSLYFNAANSQSTPPRLFRGTGTAASVGPIVPRVKPLPGMVGSAGRLWMPRRTASRSWPDTLWVSDGTAAGTQAAYGGSADWFMPVEGVPLENVGLAGRIWFAAGPGAETEAGLDISDEELWSSDGTTAGTVRVTDIHPTGSSEPRSLAKLGRTILFSARDDTRGRELWALDVS